MFLIRITPGLFFDFNQGNKLPTMGFFVTFENKK